VCDAVSQLLHIASRRLRTGGLGTGRGQMAASGGEELSECRLRRRHGPLPRVRTSTSSAYRAASRHAARSAAVEAFAAARRSPDATDALNAAAVAAASVGALAAGATTPLLPASPLNAAAWTLSRDGNGREGAARSASRPRQRLPSPDLRKTERRVVVAIDDRQHGFECLVGSVQNLGQVAGVLDPLSDAWRICQGEPPVSDVTPSLAMGEAGVASQLADCGESAEIVPSVPMLMTPPHDRSLTSARRLFARPMQSSCLRRPWQDRC
jgi:hypothetical protein